tara:strand:+ start:139 stop:537 length:399 start_codon:yes stop_codon:yes gene_type:complete
MNQKPILAEISVGELIDKITILQIKDKFIQGSNHEIVKKELTILSNALMAHVVIDDTINALTTELQTVNQSLWDIEDAIRICEKHKDFGDTFIDLARSVYKTNDKRADLKKKINLHVGSNIAEVKSYEDYES